jgi:hypothetical protein
MPHSFLNKSISCSENRKSGENIPKVNTRLNDIVEDGAGEMTKIYINSFFSIEINIKEASSIINDLFLNQHQCELKNNYRFRALLLC